MKIVCDACSAKYSIADEKVAGKVFKIRCKKCSNIIVVRGSSGEEAAAAAPAQEQQPNKETKVFDYQGYDSPQEAMAAEEGEWHLVIDQEQVGPMTADEVRLRFASGEVDSESYIWKEGFTDWEHIPDVAEFADLAGGVPAEAAPADDDANMFGTGDLDDATSEAPAPAAMAAVSNDLFGGDAGGGADLFGGAAAAGSDLFGGGAPVGDHTGEISMSKEAEAQLKGQRNENSVLFSLGNLAALASDTPKSVAPTASPSGGIANTGGSEGSGLIDIRSMASVYLADKGGGASASMPAGSTDDLPVFSQSAFESASPVLLPTQSGGTDKKVLYALIGVIGALLIAAAILLMVVLGGDDEPTAAEVAEAEQALGEGSDTELEPAEVEADPASENVEAPDEVPVDPVADPAEAAPDVAQEPEPKADPKSPAASRRDKRKEREAKRAQKPTRTPKPTPDPKPSKSGSCDEVTCLVNPGAACCRKFAKKSGGDSGSKSSNSNLPEKLSRSDISSGIGRVKGRVSSCGDKHGGKGTVRVKIKIGGNGKVTSAQASGGSSALRSCVTSAVKRAKFPKTQKGMSVTYPFVFR